MTDEQLKAISYLVDDMILELSERSSMSSLSITAIILARSIRINDECGTGGQFRKMLSEACTYPAVDDRSVQ